MFKLYSKSKIESGKHRTWFKLLFNPILTKFGWIIVSVFNYNDDLLGYEFREYPEQCKGPFRVWFKIRF